MAEPPSPPEPSGPDRRGFFWPGGLSARLLILTSLFVLFGGALIVPPTLAAFEEQWLLDRVRAAELASLATEVAPDVVVSEQLSSELLEVAGVEWVAIQSDGVRRLVLRGAN
ncbi:MAG: sensor histidine kinase, partial [Phenylobacterium sp.]